MMRSLHFWPHDLRPTAEAPTIPSFEQRLVPAPARSIPITPPECLHQDRASHGSTRNGNPRFRCKICTRSFVEKPGNNRLKPAKAEALRQALLSGIGVRAAADQTHVAKRTASYYRRLWAIETNCACGQPAGHRGWCRERLRNSPRRQKVMVQLHGGISEQDRKCWQDMGKAIRKSARAFGASDVAVDAGLVMLAGLLVHFDLCRTVELTGLAFADVERFAARFRQSGIWKGRYLSCDWGHETAGDIAFWMDAMVGAGELDRLASRRRRKSLLTTVRK